MATIVIGVFVVGFFLGAWLGIWVYIWRRNKELLDFVDALDEEKYNNN